MGGRLIFRSLHGCSPIRLYCHWSGKLANTLGDLDKYLFTFFGYESLHTIPVSHWTYFTQIISNYNSKILYHFENSVSVALKSDIFTFYKCEINKDIWLQLEKIEKKSQDGAGIQKSFETFFRPNLLG